MSDLQAGKEKMLVQALAGRGIGKRVIDAFRRVPRERFVPKNLAEFAYADYPLPIGEGQTISQPYVVALTAQQMQVGPRAKVLEVGGGSGYAAAILSRMVGRVVTIERIVALADTARRRLQDLGYDNILVVSGDGTEGYAAEAPYDAIAVAAAGPKVPQALKEQLKIGGRLVIPVGGESSQSLRVVTRTGQSTFVERDAGAVRFVPLIGRHGWDSSAEGEPGREL